MQACGFTMLLADGSSAAEEGTLSLPMHNDLTDCRATYHLLQTALPASPGEPVLHPTLSLLRMPHLCRWFNAASCKVHAMLPWHTDSPTVWFEKCRVPCA